MIPLEIYLGTYKNLYLIFFSSYLDRLERIGGKGLKAYSSLLEGGANGIEIQLFKEYFSCVQLAISPNPETVVRQRFVDVCLISYLMRVMGYYPSELEVSWTLAYFIQYFFFTKNINFQVVQYVIRNDCKERG